MVSEIDNKKTEIKDDDRVKIINEKLNHLIKSVDGCDSVVPMAVADTAMSIADVFHDPQKEIDKKTIMNLLNVLSVQTTEFYYDCGCKKEKRKVGFWGMKLK